MIIDLEPIFNNEGLSRNFDFELDLSDVEFNACKPFTTPVRVEGTVENSTGIVELSATAVFSMSLFCDRCATELVKQMCVPVNHTLVTHLNDDNNDELLLINELRFDLDPLITEDIFLAMPSKFLCDDDCKGVCFTCGKNLNEGPCSCQKPTDPRLEVLKQLLDN